MTICISTSLSSELSRTEQLSILLQLHKNNLHNLHISSVENKLIIHSDDNASEHSMMRLIDSNKEVAIAHFKSTFFSNVECEITAVNRYAFLPRSGSVSFTSMIESALQESPVFNQNPNAILAMRRFQNIQKRQAEISRPRHSRASDPFDDDFNNHSSSDDEMMSPHFVRSKPTMLSLIPSAQRRSVANSAHNQNPFQEYEQKIEQQKQQAAYEEKLVNLYHQSMQASANARPISDAQSDINQISIPSRATMIESQDRSKIGFNLVFNLKRDLCDDIVEADATAILSKLFTDIGIARFSSETKYHRDVMGRINSIEIGSTTLVVNERSLPLFVRDIRKALYVTGTDLDYQFTGITLTNLPRTLTATTSNQSVSSTSVTAAPTLFSQPSSLPQPPAKPSNSKSNEAFGGFKPGFMSKGF